MEQGESPGKIRLLGLVSFGLAMSAGLTAAGAFVFILEFQKVQVVLETVPALFTVSTAAGSMLVTPLLGLIFLLFTIGVLYRLATGGPPPNAKIWIVVPVGTLLIAALVGIFVMRFAVNAYWGHQFEEAGYSRCPGSFWITSRYLTAVWVQDRAYCDDQRMRSMMIDTDYDMDDINAHLRGLDG